MQRRMPMVLLVVLIAMVSAFPQVPVKDQPQPPMRPVDGAGVFRNYCAACHGADGRGSGPLAKALKQEVPDLTSLAQRNDGAFPAVHVRTTVLFGADNIVPAQGSKAMPMWGPTFHEIEFDQDLGNVRLENLVEYLESIQRK